MINEGASFVSDANQWHENGYKVVNGKIVSYFIDRKDPQYCEDPGMTIEQFLSSPNVDAKAKEWLRSMQ